MTKTLTEQWRDGTLESGNYYIRSGLSTSVEIRYLGNGFFEGNIEVVAPVPSYDRVKEMSQKIERLEFDNEALEMAHNEGKEINAELVSKTDELVQKVHILNKQNTKQYNELCEEIKKNNILEKKLEIATKALKKLTRDCNKWEIARKALKEMEGVK